MILIQLAWRDFARSRLLWVLSAVAVAMGVSTVIAADVVRSAVIRAMRGSSEVYTLMGGLTELLGSNLTAMGIAISAAAGFVVFNALGMSMARRRIQIATLRTAGMTREQVLQLALLESLWTGGAGAALGLVAGPALGALAIAALRAVTNEGMFIFDLGPPAPPAMVLAVTLGVMISLGASLAPALEASRVAPLAARRPRQTPGIRPTVGIRLAVGLAAMLTMSIYLRLTPPAAWLRPPWDLRIALLFAAVWLGIGLLMVPELAALTGRTLRRPLQSLLGASGLLVADNLRRGHRRVWLTVASLAVALALVVSVVGFTRFTGGSLMGPKLEQAAAMNAWSVAAFDPLGGMAAYGQVQNLTLDRSDVAALRDVVGAQADVLDFGFAIIPELSYFGDSYFSFVMDPADALLGGNWLFSFNQGDWGRAVERMKSGCGVLVMPTVAQQLGAPIGETVDLSGPNGPVPCTLAGVGAAFGAASIVGTTDRRELDAERPYTLMVRPQPGADLEQLNQDLAGLAEARGLAVISMQAMTGVQLDILDQVPKVLNGMAVLAVFAAALGVVNTVAAGVVECRSEFGLLRAVGATRRQLYAAVAGESALIAALGGGLGVLIGAGVTVVVATVYGGASWGLLDLDHWAEAQRILRPALQVGLLGWAAAPIIGGLAGLLPARRLLSHERLVEQLLAERH